jgi:hypothetical protein
VKLKRNFREPELQSSRSNLVAAFRINVTPISIQRASTECHESSQRQTKKEKTKCQTEQRFRVSSKRQNCEKDDEKIT